MRRYITILLLLVMFGFCVFCGCTTPKTVVLPTEERIIQNDSTIIIYRDSIIEKRLSDTVFIEKYYNTTHYKTKTDTINNRESVTVEVPVEVTPDWCHTLLYINIGIALLFILWIVYRVTKFIYLRR